MSVQALPSSPNWYCGNIIDVTDGGFVAYGARSDINILVITRDYQCLVGCEETTAKPPEIKHGCKLVATISRSHKERVTFVRFCAGARGSVVADSARNRSLCTLFSGGEDGKLKQISIAWEVDAETGRTSHFQHKTISEMQLPRNVCLLIPYFVFSYDLI